MKLTKQRGKEGNKEEREVRKNNKKVSKNERRNINMSRVSCERIKHEYSKFRTE